MIRLLDLLSKRAQSLRPRYRDEFKKLADSYSPEDRQQPIFSQIEDMIEKDRFGAAESFMQQVRNGSFTIGNGELSSGILNAFLNKVENELYGLARLDRKKPLVAVYQDMHRHITNATQRSGENLTKAWPNGGSWSAEKVKTLFAELDQEVDTVSGHGPEYTVRLQKRGVIMDYPHPIAAFGSVMDQKGIEVAVISGSLDANRLYDEISKLLNKSHTDCPLLLLANSAVTVPERRKLAKKMSRITSGRPFLMLDRCLALYLADTPKTNRWKTLLRCSLPFRVINPYYESSSMPIPPDMFIGRRQEIREIMSPDGPNLLYGGRQLGKTAILRRVEFQQNRPEEGK